MRRTVTSRARSRNFTERRGGQQESAMPGRRFPADRGGKRHDAGTAKTKQAVR